MAKSKRNKPQNKQGLVPFWSTGLAEIDRTFDNFRRDFEHAFTSFPFVNMPSFPTISKTACDLIDEGRKYVAHIDLPGINKQEINLKVTENSIEVSAIHKQHEEEKKKNYLRKERSEVSYHRILTLPSNVVPNKAKAKFTNGTLNIEVPKTVPTPKPKSSSVSIE
ncbi:MAG: SHSP domain-containing protein [Marine Group I thaumarchaeote]|nr:MAG: SHSP domain-containing protein [Marine Group I thaumarchaeote]